jgi:hypothetical protein
LDRKISGGAEKSRSAAPGFAPQAATRRPVFATHFGEENIEEDASFSNEFRWLSRLRRWI